MKNLDVPGPGSWVLLWDDNRPPLPDYANWRWSRHDALCIGRHTALVPDGPYVEHRGHMHFVGRAHLTNASDLEGATDAERIINAYQRWGVGFLDRLHGTFAFALWDTGRLWVARDRLGLEPMYRYIGPARTIVANDVDAVLGLPGLSLSPDPAHVVHRVTRQRYRKETAHTEIQRILPAQRGSARRAGTLTIDQWWEPRLTDPRRSSAQADAAELRQLLHDSVARLYRTEGHHGAELSGGLDSSAVVGVLAPLVAANSERLPVFSQALPPGSDHPSGDEREFIDAVLALVDGIDPHWIFPHVDPEFPALRTRSPSVGAAGGKEKLISAAAEIGVTDLWSGFGGDEFATFNGRNYLGHLLLNGRMLALGREIRGRSAIRDRPVRGVIKQTVKEAHGLLEDQRWWPLPQRADPAERYLRPSITALVDVHEEAGSPRFSIRNTLNDVQRFLLSIHPGALRAEMENSTALRYGMLFRYPLEDPRFVELALSLPPDRHTRNGWHRWLWREATDGIMPDTVRWRADKRPPMPGGGDTNAAIASVVSRTADVVTNAHPVAREWLDLERAQRDLLAAAEHPPADAQEWLTPARVLEAARRLTSEADACGW